MNELLCLPHSTLLAQGCDHYVEARLARRIPGLRRAPEPLVRLRVLPLPVERGDEHVEAGLVELPAGPEQLREELLGPPQLPLHRELLDAAQRVLVGGALHQNRAAQAPPRGRSAAARGGAGPGGLREGEIGGAELRLHARICGKAWSKHGWRLRSPGQREVRGYCRRGAAAHTAGVAGGLVPAGRRRGVGDLLDRPRRQCRGQAARLVPVAISVEEEVATIRRGEHDTDVVRAREGAPVQALGGGVDGERGIALQHADLARHLRSEFGPKPEGLVHTPRPNHFCGS
mmetsp:Transcript_93657/g.279536  ORF Transcript_93657/g.279536 Transcript_93657/m.279536 type:complete len:287 (+) Transcript_93657:1189-2049(+)